MSDDVDRYSPGEPVRVLLPGERHGQAGHVDRTYAEGGDMWHVVVFPDGGRGDFYADELKGAKRGNLPKSTSEQQESDQ